MTAKERKDRALHATRAMGNRRALVVMREVRGEPAWNGADIACTMLDMIGWLERTRAALVTVVLDGEYARDTELTSFLRETYPSADVVAATVAGKAVWRVEVSGFAGGPDANRLCAALKAGGQTCFVHR